MAAAANLVYRNFRWRVEATTPTSTIVGNRFKFNGRPLRMMPEASKGLTRAFEVYRTESGPVHEVEDITERWAEFEYVVEVAYDTEMDLEDLHMLIEQDRHDIIKVLRTTDGFNGVSAAAPTQATGLHERSFTGDTIDQANDTTWILRLTWRCTIQEIE